MRTRRVVQFATVLVALLGPAALAERAPAGPDFVARAPQRHISPDLVTSDGQAPIAPLDVVVFEHAKARLIPSAIAQVDRAAHWLRSHPGYRIVLAGHTDVLGDPSYNADLAQRRVAMVRAHLMGWGVKPDRIVIVTYGDADAMDPENPGDRRVVMYATRQSPQQVVAATMKYTDAQTAMWTEGHTLYEQHGTQLATRRTPPGQSAIATRR